MLKNQCVLAVLALSAAGVACGLAEDWYRWRGPEGNGISSETAWRTEWPDGEPKIAWKTAVGNGFSSVVVSERRLFTLGNAEDVETVFCLDSANGEVIWRHDYDCPLDPKYFDGGPTSTPTVDGERVFTLSRRGHLFCFQARTGKVQWTKNIHEETGAAIPSWGFSGAPRVMGNLLLINAGDAGMALQKETGEWVWKSETTECGYSTPYPYARPDGSLAVVFGSAKSYVAVEVESGKELWRYRWLTRFGVNAADPIVHDDQLFLSSGYNKGAALLQLGGAEPELLWKSKALRTQMNPAILHRGHLYATDGDAGNDAALKCLEWKSGEVKWEEKGIGTGGLLIADGKLVVLSSRGELLVAPASPESFQPISRAQVLGGKCWTSPVLSNGRIYCRNAGGDLVCIDARADTGQQ